MSDSVVPGQIMKKSGKYAKPQAQREDAKTVAGVQKRLLLGTHTADDCLILMDAINRVRMTCNETELSLDDGTTDDTQVVRVQDVYEAINQKDYDE